MTEADTSRTHAREAGAETLSARIRREGDLSSRAGQLDRLYALADEADTLRAQLEAAERYKVAFEEWHAKSEWVQETAQPREFGKHRADVLRERIEAAEARAEAAEADAARYRWLRDDRNFEGVQSMISVLNYGQDPYLLDGTELDAAIDAARTKEAAP